MTGFRSIHSDRLERWLGTERIEHLSQSMRDWYGPPITLLDVPGGVRVHGGGDFSGSFERGAFYSAIDAFDDKLRRLYRRVGSKRLYQPDLMNAGFTSLADAVTQMKATRQWPGGGHIQKVGTAPGAVGAAVTLWLVGNQPAAGAGAAAAPGGTVPTSASTGALGFKNAAGGETMHLIGADMSSSVALMNLLLYDRIFSVAKTMATTVAEAVTGVPSRYQSTTGGAADSAEGNFLMVEVTATLGALAHNWPGCQYTDQGGTTTVALPTVTGIASLAANRLDMPVGTWFAPLASGDTGIKALTQMQMGLNNETGGINFTIGHPLGVMAFPQATKIFPFDWLTNRDLAPRIFDDACLALLQLPASADTATTFVGSIVIAEG